MRIPDGPAIVVGSLGALDLRGTAVTPSGLVDCLWTLTHHNHSGADRLWCKVWFESLHLSTTAPGEDNAEGVGVEQLQHRQRWIREDLARLETVLAMDEMELKSSSPCGGRSSSSSEGVSYLAYPRHGSRERVEE